MHFSVMVFGDNYEDMLAPYNEQPDDNDTACTMTWECDASDGCFYQADSEEALNKIITEKNITITDGPRCYNPDGCWDWYSLGGRAQGMLLLKPNAKGIKGRPGVLSKLDTNIETADSALIKDIDFERMNTIVTNEASALYDIVMNIFGELPIHKSIADIRKDYAKACNKDYWDKTLYDDVRKLYTAQPRLVALVTARENAPLPLDPDDFIVNKETYVMFQVANRCKTHAILTKDGWFSEDSYDTIEYAELFAQALQTASPDTRISIVDCHI